MNCMICGSEHSATMCQGSGLTFQSPWGNAAGAQIAAAQQALNQQSTKWTPPPPPLLRTFVVIQKLETHEDKIRIEAHELDDQYGHLRFYRDGRLVLMLHEEMWRSVREVTP